MDRGYPRLLTFIRVVFPAKASVFLEEGPAKITSYVEGQSRKCTRRSRGRGGECGEEGCAGKRDEAEEVGVHNSKGIKHPATERSLDTLYRAPRGWMGQVQ